MKSQLFKSGDPIADGRTVFYAPVGQYLGFTIRVTGTADTGKTIAAEDFGNLQLIRNGGTLQNTSLEFLSLYGNAKGGYSEAESAEAGAFSFTFFVPCAVAGQPNAMHVTEQNELQFDIDWAAALDVEAASARYDISGLPTESVPENYEVKILRQDAIGAAAGTETHNLTGQNIQSIFFRDASAKVTRLAIEVDGQIEYTGTVAYLKALTSMANKVEGALLAVSELSLNPSGDLLEGVNGVVGMQITYSGAGTLEIWKISIAIVSSRVRSSHRRIINHRTAKINRLLTKNQSTVFVAQNRMLEIGAARPRKARGI
jgi:hypothetical protein